MASGYISSRKKIQVTIPAGIDNGQSIRIAGKGEPGINGGDRGDLLVEVTVSKHPIFKRQETTIFSTVPISFVTAALGGPIRIKTVDGEVEYEVKPGTQTDTKVRLRGKGVPSLRNKNIRGDHFVTLVITVPEKLNEEQKEALRRFDDAMNGIAPEGGKKKPGTFWKIKQDDPGAAAKERILGVPLWERRSAILLQQLFIRFPQCFSKKVLLYRAYPGIME